MLHLAWLAGIDITRAPRTSAGPAVALGKHPVTSQYSAVQKGFAEMLLTMQDGPLVEQHSGCWAAGWQAFLGHSHHVGRALLR